VVYLFNRCIIFTIFDLTGCFPVKAITLVFFVNIVKLYPLIILINLCVASYLPNITLIIILFLRRTDSVHVKFVGYKFQVSYRHILVTADLQTIFHT
jgi:hypothetical protein